ISMKSFGPNEDLSTMTAMGEHSLVTIYAHTLPDRPKSEWETLDVHAGHVSEYARSFAGAFGASNWGELLGRWHDLGKRSDDFQNYLCFTADPDAAENEDTVGRVDHSTFGARYAVKRVGGHFGQLL